MTDTPLMITIEASELWELLRLVTMIEMPDVTYSEDNLQMAQQALRLNKMYAVSASEILYKYMRDKQVKKEE